MDKGFVSENGWMGMHKGFVSENVYGWEWE